jgi:hypothetical protein
MKQLILVAGLVSAALLSYGQCEKKVVLTASKTQHLGADSTVQSTDEENTVVEFDRSTIEIAPGDNEKMTGKVNSSTCNWPAPYKNGHSQLRITLTNSAGRTKDATVTIDGKDGRVTLFLELDGMPDRKIRLVADKFEEKH